MSMNEQQQSELVALVSWLQTFPDFKLKLCDEGANVDANSVSDALQDIKAARATLQIAHVLCETKQDDSDSNSSPDEIWTSLLMLTSTRARPLPADEDGNNSKLGPHRLKLYVLANLLDCAVSFPDLNQRRQYIERIMTLQKGTQKTLMSLIERRRRNKTPKKGTPKSSRKSTPSKSSDGQHTPQRSGSQARETPTRTSSNRRSSSRSGSSGRRVSQSQEGTPKTPRHSSRSLSDAFGPSPVTGLSPQPKRSTSAENQLLSPATLESPQQVQRIVQDLQLRNEQFQEILQTYRAREKQMQAQMEAREQEHRKEMLKVESKSLDQHQELQQQYEERFEALQLELAASKEESAKGQAALQELQEARDEMDLMSHSKSVLSETAEKLRKYKDKVTELQDVKEALRREQEAQGKSVDEIVRLENELQALQPVKRQVDEYKIRAIEAEVKLVECQDYLRRMEQQATDQSAVNENLWKGTVMQKEQMEELVERIQKETQANIENSTGVGDGISELNPQLKEELVRLRNENLQLRAFASKRQEDAVQRLESNLDDSKRLAEKYKNEYLQTKDTLVETQGTLTETQQREANLINEVDGWKERCSKAETQVLVLQEKLEGCQKELNQTRQDLEEAQSENASLQGSVESWTQKANDVEAVSKERMERLEKLHDELDETKSLLVDAEELIGELRGSSETWESHANELESQLSSKREELDETQESLNNVRTDLEEAQCKVDDLESQVESLKEQRMELEDRIDEECQARHEALEEAEMALETTREELTAKAKQEKEELQANMNRLLEDERKALRQKEEEHNRRYQELQESWQNEYQELQDRSTSSLKNSRQEAQERIEFLKEEYQAELEYVKKEGDDKQNEIIRKGRTMLEDAKADARDEIQKLVDQKRDLENELDVIEREKKDLEHMLRSKISKLKQNLEFTAGQVNELSNENDDLNENIKMLEREKFKLQEDNERYRRQLGGRYGVDGRSQSQLEKLQKECNDLLEENRQLKQQVRFGIELETIPEAEESGSYSRGGVSRSTLTALRSEYEEKLAALNDEKRELVMKNSAAVTDVRMAEQRAWEREEEVSKLKAELTSLKLALQRSELSQDEDDKSDDGIEVQMENRSPKDLSFFSAQEEANHSTEWQNQSPARHSASIVDKALHGSPLDRSQGSPAIKRSPNIERAMRAKEERENQLRSKFTSLSSSPARPPKNLDITSSSPSRQAPLTPSKKYEQESNQNSFQDSQVAKMSSDVYGLGTSPPRSQSKHKTSTSFQPADLLDTVQRDKAENEGQQECQQS